MEKENRISGQPKRAVELFGELLPDSVRLLGEHHPHTVSTRYRLGLSAREVGRTEEAVRQLTIVHREWVDTFGADHQGVARVRDLLDELGANQI